MSSVDHDVGMAKVEVFVDDAVRGQLPHVCAKTGVPANGKLRISQTSGGIGLAGLLIFFGPIGWLVLLVIAFSARSETLTVRLPYSGAAVDRELQLRHMRLVGSVVGVSSVIAALVARSHSGGVWVAVFVLVGIAAALVAVVHHFMLCWTRVGVRLDASRRWVTLSRVHPEFARAVDALRTSAST
jgi:hypothetical protein